MKNVSKKWLKEWVSRKPQTVYASIIKENGLVYIQSEVDSWLNELWERLRS